MSTTPTSDIAPDAAQAARDNVVLVTLSGAIALYDAMAERFVSYYSQSGTGTAIERGNARRTVAPRLPQGDWLAELLTPRGVRFIDRADVDRLFVS